MLFGCRSARYQFDFATRGRVIHRRLFTFDVHPNQISTWREQLLQGASDVFDSGEKSEAAAPAIDVKSLHAKIGQLALENDFLSGALDKAGLLTSARK